MIRALAVFTFIPAYMILASLLGYPIARLVGSPTILYVLGRFGIRIALLLAGTRIMVEGEEHLKDTRNTIVMPNHQSLLDAPIVVTFIPSEFKVVAKTEIFRIPFFSSCLRFAGFIEVDRSNRERATWAIQKAVASLKKGNCFLIFPEGTRSPTGALGPFKKGAFHVALDAGSRIVPVALIGARDLMPKGGFRIRKGVVRVRVLDPVDAGSYSYEDRERLIAEVRQRIADALAN
ncbi:MAG TPA: lysophospholipid acyltransferase family protein [Vicinamibacteria bacterium]|jgi:1-acyl-sn-glycerol-3-phosphate acyltransferase|nr:lysophospholipid acyltransferase family protein [Vicinamibacteria bacterium]